VVGSGKITISYWSIEQSCPPRPHFPEKVGIRRRSRGRSFWHGSTHQQGGNILPVPPTLQTRVSVSPWAKALATEDFR